MAFFISEPITASVPSGNYLEFNGGYIKAQNTNFVPPTVFSFDVWIKPKNISGIRHILTIGDASTSSINYQVGINGSSLQLNYFFNNSSQRLIAAGNLAENVWQHIKINIDASSTNLFINDNQVFSGSGANGLRPLGKDIYVGKGFSTGFFNNNYYYGDMDELQISQNQSILILWHFDQARGEVQVNDASGNNISGILTGGDSKIHFFGILPTPTKFVLPTLRPIGFITLMPRPTSTDDSPEPQPTLGGIRTDRPVLSR